ncbi:MAG: BrnA antitoxin family protein [Zoogloeaceae bacterium]|nr:BrnA antitoxin family protein [Zoogloeaceae bacterium]
MDELSRWRAKGKGWQTRIAELLAAVCPKSTRKFLFRFGRM